MLTKVLSHMSDNKKRYIIVGVILILAYLSNAYLGTNFDLIALKNILIGM